jgi:bacillithiol biosynthesis deacetylase BshB1
METKYDVISVGAHPDDVEVGTGGVLAKLKKTGYRAGIVYLTRGEMGTGGSPEVREDEARRAAEIMGADILETFDWGDTKLVDKPEYRYHLAHVFRKYKPKLVLAPWPEIGHGKRQCHPDHVAAGQLVMNSVYYASFRRLPIEGDVHAVKNILYYFLPFDVSPTIIVDISDEFEEWMGALKAHKSQFLNPEKSMDYMWHLESLGRSYGMMVGAKYGHGFRNREPLRIDDLFRIFESVGPERGSFPDSH